MTEESGNAEKLAPVKKRRGRPKKAPSIEPTPIKQPPVSVVTDTGFNPASIPADASANVPEDPMEIHRQMAGAIAESLEKSKKEAEKQEEIADAQNHVWFAICRTFEHPAVFFSKNPMRHRLFPKDWYSSKKPPGMHWPASEVPCQHEGCSHLAPVKTHQQGHLIVNPRFMRSMAREEFVKLASGEGGHGSFVSEMQRQGKIVNRGSRRR